jgi:hypothetical protein
VSTSSGGGGGGTDMGSVRALQVLVVTRVMHVLRVCGAWNTAPASTIVDTLLSAVLEFVKVGPCDARAHMRTLVQNTCVRYSRHSGALIPPVAAALIDYAEHSFHAATRLCHRHWTLLAYLAVRYPQLSSIKCAHVH